jgi:putative salt-induced outer membrane protein
MSLLLFVLATPSAVAPSAQTLSTQAAPEEKATSLPRPVRAMIETAIAGGDAGAVATVIAIAREANPGATAEIDAIEAEWKARLADKKAREAREAEQRLAHASMLANWKGQVEFGASRSTGNTSNLGIYAALTGEREGLNWRHKVTARADLQRTGGITTTQRVLASWQPNYKVDERLYAYGLAQYEHDRFLGYENRYTLGGGLGYGIIDSDAVKLEFEGGPAFRVTDLTQGKTSPTLAGRASLDFAWKITPTVQLSQTGAFYLESDDGSASTLTALDTQLLGSLKARFSYNIQYERGTPPGVDPVDTLSRATLIYSF